MKLIVQIPCLNEEKTIYQVLSEIPKKIKWIDIIETMIIDDWSTDKTIEIAKKAWVNHIVKHIWNKWLWEAFKSWSQKAIDLWADILVNTDWDNQYPWKYISYLVQAIIEKKSDIVIADRQTSKVKHFSIIKKFFQWLWSLMVRKLSNTKVWDSVSWFRAYSRDSLLKLNITSRFSYVIDSIIQAWSKWIKIDYIKIETNEPTRKSRLFKNIWQHIIKSSFDMLRIYAMYHPLKVFITIWMPFLILWIIWLSRFLYFYTINPVDTWKVQSLVISWVFIILAIQFFALWIIWDMIAKNRKLLEENLYLSKKSINKNEN